MRVRSRDAEGIRRVGRDVLAQLDAVRAAEAVDGALQAKVFVRTVQSRGADAEGGSVND